MKLSEEESKSFEESRQYIPSIPKKWAPYKKKPNEPEFGTVDNHGNWIEYVLWPELESQKGTKYKCHFLATSVKPVPLGVDGQFRSNNHWNL